MTRPASRHRRRRQPRVAWPVTVLAVVAVVGGVISAVRGDGADPGGDPLERVRSAAVAGEPPVVPGPGPDGYRISYLVRRPGQRDQPETVTVRRPYTSRRETQQETQETEFARLAVRPANAAATIVTPPPAAVDARPNLVTQRAAEEGLLQPRETRVVAGRRCQVHRGEHGVASSTITAPLPRRFTDVCVDGDGLVLEEWRVVDGVAAMQRVATLVELAAPAAEQLSSIPGAPTIDAARGGGSVLPVDPASEPQGRFFVLPSPPEGFTLRGRYSVVPPQPSLGPEAGGQGSASPIASTADVYERGADVLVVDRGGTLDLSAAFAPRPEGRPLDLGPALGQGELLLTWNGPEARVALADGKFVRVYGTVPIDVAVATARALVETPGGPGLVFLDR